MGFIIAGSSLALLIVLGGMAVIQNSFKDDDIQEQYLKEWKDRKDKNEQKKE